MGAMIEVLPALPCEQQPEAPRVIDLVAMKQFSEWFNTWCTPEQYEAYHFGGLTFQQKHDQALAWAQQRNHEFDERRGETFS